MGLIAKDKGSGDFEPLSAGMHHAVCYGIIDLGTQAGGQFEPKRKVAFLWEVPSERIQFEKEGKKHDLPRGISAMFTLSLSTKSKMRPMLESWRGRVFTAEELNGFDLKTVLSANCLINVVHQPGTGANAGKVYANVASVSPLAKGMAKLKSENLPVFFSLDECKGEITLPPGIPDWLKAKIMTSEECMREQRQAGAPTEAQMANVNSGAPEEDVPF